MFSEHGCTSRPGAPHPVPEWNSWNTLRHGTDLPTRQTKGQTSDPADTISEGVDRLRLRRRTMSEQISRREAFRKGFATASLLSLLPQGAIPALAQGDREVAFTDSPVNFNPNNPNPA